MPIFAYRRLRFRASCDVGRAPITRGESARKSINPASADVKASSNSGESGVLPQRLSIQRDCKRVPEWPAAISRHALDAEFRCLLIRRHDDPKPHMEFAGVEKAHAKNALCRGGRLHAFIHEPKSSVSVELVLKPNSRDPVPCSAPEKRKECLPHPLGQFEIGDVELSCFGGKKNVER